MISIQSVKDTFDNGLKALYSPTEIDFIFFTLAEKYLHKDKTIIRAGLHEEWEETEMHKKLFELALLQLKMGVPYQYVIGETQFMDSRIFVNQQVLIPRPETEELVEWIIHDYTKAGQIFNGTILDIGTGSGAIAIALKKAFPEATVYAVDVDEKALEVAIDNAKYNQVKIHFLQKDILNNDWNDLPYLDIIVSNPPYIPEKEKEKMNDTVVKYEPEKALFVPNENPLLFYRTIAEKCFDKMKHPSHLYLEIHQDLKDETVKMLEGFFTKVEAKKDISDNWRMIKASGLFSCA